MANPFYIINRVVEVASYKLRDYHVYFSSETFKRNMADWTLLQLLMLSGTTVGHLILQCTKDHQVGYLTHMHVNKPKTEDAIDYMFRQDISSNTW
jgi:hypothetical protein